MVCGAAGLVAGALTVAPAVAQHSTDAPDTLILHGGRTVNGRILEETDTRIKFLLVSGSIKAERWFEKSDILKVNKGEAAPADPAAPSDKPAPTRDTMAAKDPVKKVGGGARVYVIDLKGKFGEDITQTPLREAFKDAKRQNADHIIITLENEWAINELEKLPDDAAAFDQLFRAEEMTPIFVEEVPREWEKPPKIIFWVKQAMGGAAFMPFVCPNIYMSSDARIGGIGNLSTMFGGTGDEVVRQKQYSLRLGHAQGWAIVGGYEPKLVTAMTRVEYILSFGMEGGRPVYVERYPQNPGETLLTDDGKDANADTLRELVTGTGNDVLTLNADMAKKLLVSKGTVDSLDDLLFELGLLRNYERVDKRSPQIFSAWSRGLEDAKRDLRRLWEEYGEVQVEQPGGFTQRTQARGKRIAKIEEMQRIMTRYKESLTGQFYGEYQIPSYEDLDLIKEQIRQEQMADRR
jgi:hypothetical protein